MGAGADHAAIEGVVVVPLVEHADARGSMRETYRREWVPGSREMVQANLSRSRAGVLRGLHIHREQSDFWSVVSGSAFIALVDLRTGSPTQGRKMELEAQDGDPRVGLYIPPGVAHGFCAVSDVQLLYLVDQVYTGTDEFGLAWDDPDVGIGWPVSDPVLSDRDRNNPRLRDAPVFPYVPGD